MSIQVKTYIILYMLYIPYIHHLIFSIVYTLMYTYAVYHMHLFIYIVTLVNIRTARCICLYA